MSEFALAGRYFGPKGGSFNCTATIADDNLGASGKYFRNGQADWDPGYGKQSCASGSYLAGISSNPRNWSLQQSSLCCAQAGIGGDDCTTVVVGQSSPEQNTSTTLDANGNVIPLDWDSGYPKAECGAGRRMMGSSYDRYDALHAILCCRTPAPSPAQASTSCCSPQTLQVALANCNRDHATYDSDCNNIVAPCCDSDPNSDGAGGAVCAADAAAANADASSKDGDPDANTGGTTKNSGASCGASGTALAWSYAYKKSGSAGNKTFGAGFSGQVTFGAGPIYANGEASVSAQASLFGQTLTIALVDLKGSITDANPLSAEVKVLGSDLYVYPSRDNKQTNDAGAPPPTTTTDSGTDWTFGGSSSSPGMSDSDSLTYTETFFTEQEVVILFGVPITITGTIAGQVGLQVSANSAGSTLAFSATPWVGATATCSAARGGGKGSFKLTAGVQGSLNLFTASLPTTATISPFTNHVNYTIGSDFTLSALDGNIEAFLTAKLKPVFKKTFKTTLASWSGVTSTTHLFHYNGCVSY